MSIHTQHTHTCIKLVAKTCRENLLNTFTPHTIVLLIFDIIIICIIQDAGNQVIRAYIEHSIRTQKTVSFNPPFPLTQIKWRTRTSLRVEIDHIECFLEEHGVIELEASATAWQLQQSHVQSGSVCRTDPVHCSLQKKWPRNECQPHQEQ